MSVKKKKKNQDYETIISIKKQFTNLLIFLQSKQIIQQHYFIFYHKFIKHIFKFYLTVNIQIQD